MKSCARSNFVWDGLKQAASVFVVFLVLAGIGFVGVISDFVQPFFGLMCAVMVSLLSGPIPSVLTLLDITDTQFYWLWAVFVIPYWIFLGGLAAFLRWKYSPSSSCPEEDATSKRSLKHMRWTLETIALVLAVLAFPRGPIAGPNQSYVRSTRAVKNAIINNLRQLDGAKQQFALEKKLSTDYVPTEAELSPYLRNFHAIGPERYVLNAIRDAPYAVLDSDWRIRRRGWREGATYPKGEYRLP